MGRKVLVTGGAGLVGNLSRRGRSLTSRASAKAGVEFVRGDVRVLSQMPRLGPADAVVECSRRDGAQLVFLSTSRVYPYTVDPLPPPS